METIRGEPKKPDLTKAIFERTFYFCKLSGITIKDYIRILIIESKKRGIL